MCMIFLFFFPCWFSTLSPVKKTHHTTIFLLFLLFACILYPLACKTTMIKGGGGRGTYDVCMNRRIPLSVHKRQLKLKVSNHRKEQYVMKVIKALELRIYI